MMYREALVVLVIETRRPCQVLHCLHVFVQIETSIPSPYAPTAQSIRTALQTQDIRPTESVLSGFEEFITAYKYNIIRFGGAPISTHTESFELV